MISIWPVPGYYAIHPEGHFDDWRSYGLHAGIDVPAPAVPTIAVAGGVVIYTGWAGSAGRSVYIALDDGHRVHYCHLSRIDVAVNQRVAADDIIGLVGGSGDDIDGRWGSHLHLNLFAAAQPTGEPSKWIAWVGMWAVDPELYLGEEDDDMDEATVRRIVREEVIKHNDGSRHLNIGEIEATLQGLNDRLKAQVRRIAQEEAGSGGAGYTDARAVKAVKDALPG